MPRTPPKVIQEQLANLGIGSEGVKIAAHTDINEAGQYDEQWLVVTDAELFLFDPAVGVKPVRQFKLEEIGEARVQPAVGSGLLQVKVGGVWLDLVRFSNRLKYEFDQVQKALWKLKAGEAPEEIPESDPQRCPNCGLMLESPGELCLRCINHRAALTRVIVMMKPYWPAAVVMMVLLVIGIALDMAWPLLTRFLVDFVLVTDAGGPRRVAPYSWLAQYSPQKLLVLVVLTLACVHVVRAVINLVNGRISGRVSNSVTFDIRARLVKKLEELSLSFYSRQETGSLVGRVAYDTEAVQSFMTQVTSGFLMQFLLVILSFIMMLSLEPRLAFWATIPAPFVLGGAVAYWRFVHPDFQRYWYRSSKQAGFLDGLLSGIRVVKAFAREEDEFNRFQKVSGQVRDTKWAVDRTSAYFYPIMAIVFQVGGWIIWYVGGKQVLGTRMSLGTLMAFFGYLSMFYGPLGSLTNLTTWFTQFTTQVHRIFEILDTPTVLPEPKSPVKMGEVRGAVTFKDVTFGYARGNAVLKNLNFEIRPHEKIGIVGRSGSGKTSIINLLSRFYDVDSGAILLDGVDIREFSTHDLRRQISLVLQEPFLFHGSLTENITYGKPEATRAEVLEVSRAANAHDLIMKRPLAYDSSVGERGSQLSGGERQRISIARALLCPTPVLVLDEATSSIDSESELAIQLALDEASKKRTTIIIAHRLSTVKSCDRIYVVDGGHIVEQGSHRELMNFNGRYARWVKIQQGEGYGEVQPAEGSVAGEAAPKGPQRTSEMGPARWLKPGEVTFETGERQGLVMRTPQGDVYEGVFALRCFPIQDPARFISIRYVSVGNQVREVGLISDLSEWPESSRRHIERVLKNRYFFHSIERVKRIEEFAQFLFVEASTDLGDVEFVMRYQPEYAQDAGPNGKLFVDVEENFYMVPDLKKMPRPDRALLGRYIYW